MDSKTNPTSEKFWNSFEHTTVPSIGHEQILRILAQYAQQSGMYILVTSRPLLVMSARSLTSIDTCIIYYNLVYCFGCQCFSGNCIP